MKMKKLSRYNSFIVSFSIMIFAIVMIFSMFSTGSKAEEKQSAVINYVALGDSIATGAVTDTSNIVSYVTYFHQYLQSYYGDRASVTLQNLAHTGDSTNELLSKLQTNDKVKNAISKADIITISIGGNNLLKAAQIPGFASIDKDVAQQGVEDFKKQWPEIIKAVKKLNGEKNAKIIVTTVYNPYNSNPSKDYKKDKNLYNLIGSYLSNNKSTGINQIIYYYAKTGYKIADTYKAFEAYSNNGMGKITYLYPWFYIWIIRNPHPNETGQKIITNLHKAAFESFK